MFGVLGKEWTEFFHFHDESSIRCSFEGQLGPSDARPHCQELVLAFV